MTLRWRACSDTDVTASTWDMSACAYQTPSASMPANDRIARR